MHPHLELPKEFEALGLETRFLKALAKMGFTTPTTIQQAIIPHALGGRDILGQARTGTGKTAAFGLPILQQMDPAARLQALCLTPTRELAVQVTGELQRLAAFANLRVVAVYGGQKLATQLHQLGRKPHFVVGTPGRVMDFMRRGSLTIDRVRFAVLDEVDRMLDIGFRDDIRAILSRIKGPHQTLFVSATISDEIKRLTQRYMNEPVEVNVSQDRLTVDEVDQSYVTAEPRDKFRLLHLILQQEDPPICIVFCNTKAMARKLAARLHGAGVNVKEIHGDLVQQKRDRVMERFRRHKIQVLVATDLAARGIDVSKITHIINYDIPADAEAYVHRIGRTARMGERGVAITFVTRAEGKELTNIEKLINRQIPPREVAGFAASQAEEPAPAEAVAAAPSRYQTSVFSDEKVAVAKPPPRTLGGRFPTKRRRRL